VDNASTDSTNKVIARYNDERLRYVKNEKNLGLFGNFNRCIELAGGKYIHILHSDDCIDRKFTETCVDFLEAHPDVAMTFGSVEPFVNSGERKNRQSSPPVIYPVPEGFRKTLEARNFISCPTVMMRKDVYDSYGYYSLEYPYSGDFYHWLRITRHFSVASVPDARLYYRTGDHSESFLLLFKTPLGYIDMIKIYVRIIDELGEDRRFYQRELNAACQRHMRDCLFAGIARYESMTGYSSLIFIGFALSMWSLMKPQSVSEWINKTGNFFLISAIACLTLVPGGQYITRKIFRLDTKGY